MAKGKTNYPSGGIDTSDATAGAGDIVSPKTAYGSTGTKLTGTITEKVGSATVITPSTSDQTIPEGRYGGAAGDGKVLGDADLVAANIKTGVNIFGVVGTHNGLPASMDSEGYIQAGTLARIYYRKYGKLYIFGEVGNSDGTSRYSNLLASNTTTLNAICSSLGISLDSYYAASSNQSYSFLMYNGSNWIYSNSTQYKLFAILAA